MGKNQIVIRASAAAIITLLLFHSLTHSQTRPAEGLRQNTPNVHALTNARIVIAPGRVLEKATLVVRNNVIEAVGANATPPADAKLWDLKGQTIYPGLIEMYSSYGLPQPARPAQGQSGPPASSSEEKNKGAAHWNSAARPEKMARPRFYRGRGGAHARHLSRQQRRAAAWRR